MEHRPVERIELEDGHVDLRTGQVRRTQKNHKLTTMELRALSWLVDHPDQEVTHDDLLTEVWNYAPGVVSRAPYFTMRRLRAKLEVDPNAPVLLQTVHGVGYRYRGHAAPTPPIAERRAGNLGPHQPALVGRDALLDTLLAYLETTPWLGLYGPPGVGKTSLASQLAKRLGGEGWLCRLERTMDPATAARSVAELLGRQPSLGDPLPAIEAVPGMLADRGGVALILDDVSPAVAATLAAAWTRQVPELKVIATLSRRPPGPSAFLIPPLEPADGATLLRRSAAKLGRSLPESDEEALRTLSERLDGLPLALELIAPRLGLSAPARLLKSRKPLAVASLSEAITHAWSTIEAPARRILQICGAFAGGATLDHLAHVSGLTEEDLLDGLQDLADRCLVKITDPPAPLEEPRFAVFASLRAFLNDLDGQDTHREGVRSYISAHGWALREAIERGEALAHLRLFEESANLSDALLQPHSELAARLALDPILRSGGTPEDRWRNACRAVELAEDAGGDWLTEALLTRAHATRGTPREDLSDFERADRQGKTSAQRARSALGWAGHHLHRGRLSEARPQLERAWELAPDAMPALQHAILQARLHVSVYLSDLDTSEELAQTIIAHRKAHGLEHLPQMNLAIWHDLRGDVEAMRTVLESDIQRHALRGEQARQANALMNLGYLQLQKLEPEARASLHTAVTLSQRAGNRSVECLARLNLSIVLAISQEADEAMTEARAAHALATALDNPRQRAKCSLALGQISMVRRDDQAEGFLSEAAAAADRHDDAPTSILARMLLASALAEGGAHDEATHTWRRAAEDLQAGLNPERLAIALAYHRALLDLCLGDASTARDVLSTAPPSSSSGLLRAWIDARR